ncbi:DUF3795 domain-containing protein [Clostridium sp. LIBA-8841]|uniref:DUF3795 domain-containing protein n=1 Tax=Clostridium sp. LIBA-8841 TaxID=2987530 RepID=UPI002AC6ACC3|nr:DUF3795 domain-containing protein [Clostridium sp. LIBA-8841]MDZ5253705.1 DUF3795 domain-containing protein [Clostridium sp. LIBA-8841]
MNIESITKRIGYCGLICPLCHEADKCSGCKSENNCCGRHLSSEGCFQFNCCIKEGINGCWECEEAPCDKDMFSEEHDIKNRTFVKVAKNEGIEKLAQYVAENQSKGIIYGWNKDYDNLGSEEAIVDLLHNGINIKVKK